MELKAGGLSARPSLGWLFGVVGAYVGMKLSRGQSFKAIADLDEKKDFEVAKENVSSLELKKPTMWRRGHIVISTLGAVSHCSVEWD